MVSHFSGSPPLLLEIKPGEGRHARHRSQSGANREGKLTAYRPADARAKGLPEPTDSTGTPRDKKPNEVFKFSFPDVDGKILSNNDSRSRARSWSPS